MYGHSKIAEMLTQKSAEFNIDLNAKDKGGITAFHFACSRGWKIIVEMIIDNTESFKADLTKKDSLVRTGLQHIRIGQIIHGKNYVAKIIKERMPNIAY